jgi:4-amino-4-deoxy-L-arabinose transferase-like glycosyltransferase
MRNSDSPDAQPGYFEGRRATLAPMLVIVLVSVVLRLWALGSVPTVFFHDECDNTFNAVQILQGKGPSIFGLDWNPHPALAVNLIAQSIRWLGPSLEAIRLPTVVLTVLALLPFFFLARRVAGPVPALLANLLFAVHLCYLHWSRAAWPNAQICLYTLLAMEAVTRAEEREGQRWWVVAGFSAAVGVYTYFGGRAIILTLLAYAPIALARSGANRRRVAIGLGLMVLTFIVCVAPLYSVARRDWSYFNRRAASVLITQQLPANYTLIDVAQKALSNGFRSAQTFFNGGVNNQPRYYPVGRPMLDVLGNILFLIGAVMSFRHLRHTALWWLAFVVPFMTAHMLTLDSPNPGRGIVLIPIVHLFMALGMRKIESIFPMRRRLVQSLLFLLVVVSAGRSVRDYFRWAESRELAAALQPAVNVADFPEWWDVVNRWVRQSDGFFNVYMWEEYKRNQTAVGQAPHAVRNP